MAGLLLKELKIRGLVKRTLQPKIKKITHITRNTKNNSFAIPAEAAATPPNPNTAAISAIIKKVIAQPNISSPPLAKEWGRWIVSRVFYFR
jgi:hypothetical protein